MVVSRRPQIGDQPRLEGVTKKPLERPLSPPFKPRNLPNMFRLLPCLYDSLQRGTSIGRLAYIDRYVLVYKQVKSTESTICRDRLF